MSAPPFSGMAAALLEAAPDAVLVVDAEGRILLLNHAAESLFGYDREELVGQAIEMLVPIEDRHTHAHLRTVYHRAPTRRGMGDYEVRACRRDGSTPWVAVSLSPAEVDGERLVVAIARDVSERRALEDRLRYLGTHDPLSGLANRAYFDEELARIGRGRSGPTSLIVADLDGLKQVNDRLGHAAGDGLIQRTGAILRGAFRAEDVVARLGGDEFGVILPGIGADRLDEAIDRARALFETAGIGISIGGAGASSPVDLLAALRRADRCMYEDKARRRAGSLR